MTDDPISLDAHRGMNAQKETDIRRRLAEVQSDQAALKVRQQEFEDHLEATPADTQQDAALKAKYLLQLFAATPEGSVPRRARLIARALDDLERLFNAEGPANSP